MNYLDTLRSPRRRLTIVAVVVALHVVMIHTWFTLKLYGNPHRGPGLIRVQIVHDVVKPPHALPAVKRPG